jgi:predicted RNase H-like HicB family nuclease
MSGDFSTIRFIEIPSLRANECSVGYIARIEDTMSGLEMANLFPAVQVYSTLFQEGPTSPTGWPMGQVLPATVPRDVPRYVAANCFAPEAYWPPGLFPQPIVCGRLEVSVIQDNAKRDAGNQAMELTAVYIQVPEGYIGFVEELPGANTQGATLEEVRENLQEAVQLVMEANRELAERSIVGQNVSRERFALPLA